MDKDNHQQIEGLSWVLNPHGIYKLPAIKKKNEYLHYSPIADGILRYRLEVHPLCGRFLPPAMYMITLGKYAPSLTIFLACSHRPIILTRRFFVDKAMIKFQGRLSLKQYMPIRHIERGIKVWVLGDSQTGYFSKFEVNCGKGVSPERTWAHVMKNLSEPLRRKFYHVLS